jgi:hypothetical protein
MSRSWRFEVEIVKDKSPLGQFPVAAGCLEPLLECVRFLAMRQGRLPAVLGKPCPVVLEPRWEEEAGPPSAAGLRARLLSDDGGEIASSEASLDAFRRPARAAAQALQKAGKLAADDVYHFRVFAFPTAAEPRESAVRPRFSVEEVQHPLPLHDLSFDTLARDSRRVGPSPDLTSNGESEDVPVFIPEAVLDETEAEKRTAGELETGGVLIGFLHRDPEIPEIFVEVTAQVPAQHARAARTRLTFTPETWTAVQAAVDLRGRGELMVGWWHSHPAREWCRDCDPSRWQQCPLARGFFSDEDRAVSAVVFGRPYEVALVAGDRLAEDGSWESFHSLYGWRAGAIAPRGFHVLGRPAPVLQGTPSTPRTGVNDHAPTPTG